MNFLFYLILSLRKSTSVSVECVNNLTNRCNLFTEFKWKYDYNNTKINKQISNTYTILWYILLVYENGCEDWTNIFFYFDIRLFFWQRKKEMSMDNCCSYKKTDIS